MRWGVLCLALAACQPTGTSTLAPVGDDLMSRQQADCEADGGRWGAGSQPGSMLCYRTTSDGGQQCSAATDCEGLCLARSRTCAPVTPLLGCNEVLTALGARTTLCID